MAAWSGLDFFPDLVKDTHTTRAIINKKIMPATMPATTTDVRPPLSAAKALATGLPQRLPSKPSLHLSNRKVDGKNLSSHCYNGRFKKSMAIPIRLIVRSICEANL